MANITKTPLGISSKLGLLNTHRALVVAETEEKKVEDALLHLVIAKINGNTEWFTFRQTKKKLTNEILIQFWIK